MSTVPQSIAAKLAYCEAHVTPFTDNAVAIGSSVPIVADFAAKTVALREAFDAREAAANAAKSATIVLNNAVEAASIALAGIIEQVRTKAKTTGNTGVFALADLPVPATPTPVGNPGTPEGLKVALKPNGSLELKWKCNNPAGCDNVIYQIYRKAEGESEFTYTGGAGQREFTDTTVPSGVASVMYSIQGTRTTGVGDAAEFVVNFGTTGGTMTASVAAAPKMAA